MPKTSELASRQLFEHFNSSDLATLVALLKRVRIDPNTGDLTISNTVGSARIVLCENGKAWVHGVDVIQVADKSIIFDAALIDLN
ncbi:hypothetical protein [Rhizobium skierniewicense]|uniref:hypothetical protein n=1 Tax=Rhizobium skierniewicense TaxID=984260 RepID=UPI001572AE34|nr:hypothetical protein [Rhizobium skierniewicense]NTF34808.1 hypothetical protein [Rhizobium skierniewicense]